MLLALLVLTGRAALADEPDQVLITYQATVGARQIAGASRSLHWSATQLAAGTQVQLRVPIDSFDSGHPGFDSLLRTALQSDRYPFAEVEGVAQGNRFEGTIILRGVSRPLRLQLETVRTGMQVVVSTTFAIDLVEFGVSLPSVGRTVAVEFLVRLSAQPQAVVAGGELSPN